MTDGIDLAEAEAVALFYNPELRVTRLRARIPEAEARTARLWQDPELALDGERLLADVDDPWLFAAGISITVPLSGRPAVRERLAEARLDERLAAVLGAEWAVVGRVRRTWLDLAQATAHQRLLTNYKEELQELIAAIEPLVAAEKLSRFQARALELAAVEVDSELLDLEVRTRDLRLLALRLLGLHPEGQWRFVVQVPEDPGSGATDDGDWRRMLTHPRMEIALAAYQVAERQLELEVRRQYPDLSIGLGIGREEGDTLLGIGLGLLPIPVWNRNRAGIATADAERTAAAAEIELTLQEAVHDLERARQRLAGTRQRLAFVRDHLAPQADAQVAEAKRLARLGRLDVTMILDAAATAHTTRLRLLTDEMSMRRDRLEVDLMLNPPVMEQQGVATVLPADEGSGS